MSEQHVDTETGEISYTPFTPPTDIQPANLPIFVPPNCAGALAERISKAILSMEGRVPKSGYNNYFKFHYATAEDVKEVARQALAEQEVFLLPSMVGLPEVEVLDKQDKYTVRYWFTLLFPEGAVHIPWVAESLDTSDKGLPKTLTTSVKYFLISMLLIPTGAEDDADEGGPGRDQQGQQGQQRRRTTTKKPPAQSSGDKPKGVVWPTPTILAIQEAEIIVPWNSYQLIGALNLSKAVGPTDEIDVVAGWVKKYLESRAKGTEEEKEAKEAAGVADAWLKKDQEVQEWVDEHAGKIPDAEVEEPEAEAEAEAEAAD